MTMSAQLKKQTFNRLNREEQRHVCHLLACIGCTIR
jgi:hypothetical protein